MFNGVLRNLLASQTDDIAKQAIKTSASKSVLNKVLPTTSIASKVSPKIDDTLELLKQEALKYKNPDEFINSQGEPLYHGGAGVSELSKGVKVLSPDDKMKYPSSGGGYIGLSTSPDAEYARQFSQSIAGNNDVVQMHLDPKAKVLTLPEGRMIDDMNSEELTALSKKYDAIRSHEDNEVRILNDKAVKTKQQLNDLYDQAHSENLPLSLEKPLSIDYGMSHRPTRTGATADNITQDVSDMGFPSDFYDHPEWYADLSQSTYRESFRALNNIRNNPDATVTIYRASPVNKINNGDWVTLSKAYAKQESLAENTPVHSFKVKARDIQFAGDDINEFGYWPGGGFDE